MLLFGSYASGNPRHDSDYDLIIVSPQFAGVAPSRRGIGLRQLWYEAGGDKPLDLICLTPAEFEQEQHPPSSSRNNSGSHSSQPFSLKRSSSSLIWYGDLAND